MLLTAWPLLRDTWLSETHADRIIRTQIHNAAAEWTRHSRDPSYLYRGTLLHAATPNNRPDQRRPHAQPAMSQAADGTSSMLSNRARRRVASRLTGHRFIAYLLCFSL